MILDKEIVTILTQISVAKREAEIKLDETDFYEKKRINKQKRLILEEPEWEMQLQDDDDDDVIVSRRERERKEGRGKRRKKELKKS